MGDEIKQDGFVVYNHPNTLDPPEEIYAFVSRDAEGREAICGFELGGGMHPMVTCDKTLLGALYMPEARRLRELEKQIGKTIHLLRFTSRQEMIW